MKKAKYLSLQERFEAPSPKLFRRIGRIGLVLAGIGAAILTAPVALPAGLLTLAGYLGTVGAVAKSISSIVVDEEALNSADASGE